MINHGRHGRHGSQFLPTERVLFNYSNVDNISGYNSFFSNAIGGGDIVPDNQLNLTNDNSKVLFQSDFNAGLDNAYDWVLAFNGAMVGPISRNASDVNGNDSIGPANIDLATLPITIDAAGANGDVYKLVSNHHLKIPNAGRTFSEMSGVFEHPGATANVTTFSFEISNPSATSSIQQADWNIDSFGAGVKNPSSITLDFKKIQVPIIEFTNRDHGSVRMGFLIDHTIYFAHEFKVGNEMDLLDFGNLNLPISDTVERTTGFITRKVGVFNVGSSGLSGISFVSTMNTAADPTLIVDYSLNSCVVYAVGAGNKDLTAPFTTGTGTTYKTVTTQLHLLTIRPKAEITTGQTNRTVFSIDRININTSSVNLDDAACIQVFWNVGISGTYNDVSLYSGLEVNKDDAVSADFTQSILIASVDLNGNDQAIISKEDILKEYRNAFSRKEIDFDGSPLTFVDRGQVTVIATPLGATTSIDVGIKVNGGEGA